MKPRKRRDWIFDDFFRDFEEEFKEMEEDIARIFEDAQRATKDRGESKPFIYGFSVDLGPNGEPRIERFSNVPAADEDEQPLDDAPEPLVDVIESETDIKVVAEIPGVSKEDISLSVAEDTLDIDVNTAARVFHKTVALPVKVLPDVSKAAYRNGVLEVSLARADENRGSSYRLTIE
jgi:HSP20 family protein